MTRSLKVSSELESIADKVDQGKRISEDEALAILRSTDLPTIGKMADRIRRRLHGDKTYYVINRHINHTNICSYDCLFCSFARKAGQPGAYWLSVEEYLQEAGGLEGVSEIHTVGGCNDQLGLEYYETLLRRVMERYPNVCCKFLTAVEIVDLAEREGLAYAEVLSRLKAAGLGMLPGGGAELFAERIRKKLCRHKATAEAWLEVHRTAHRLGLPSNATMLYGHIETDEEIVDHLARLRRLQDETGGFLCFVPLAYHPENNRLGALGWTSGQRDLKLLALARIFLDNVPHIKAYWIMLGLKLAQLALVFGADDFDGTVVHEQIYHDAGAKSPEALTAADIEKLIQEAGLKPVLRDAFYHPLEGSSQG